MPLIDPLTLNLLFLCVVAMALWYPCCTQSTAIPCSYCSTTPSTVTVTLSGVGNGACNCSFVNTTFILPQTAACNWQYQQQFTCSTPNDGLLTVQATAGVIPGLSGNWGWTVRVYVALPGGGIINTITYYWNSGGTTAFDCTATRTLTFYASASLPDLCSGWSSASCTIN